MLGAVKGNDPTTGSPYDDTRRYIDASSLSAADKQKIFEGNALKVFPRLKSKLEKTRPTRGDPVNKTTNPPYIPFHPNPSKPRFKVPAGAVDAHCHVFGPASRFPYARRAQIHPGRRAEREVVRSSATISASTRTSSCRRAATARTTPR